MLRRPLNALAAALACAAGVVLAWLLTFHSGAVRWLDAAALQGFVDLRRPRVEPLADAVSALADPVPLVLIGAALTLAALARDRPRAALAVPFVIGGATVTSQILKPLLADPRVCHCLADDRLSMASWPSGHATGAMALALAAVIVAPPRLRPTAAAVGAILAVGVGYSLMVVGWHFPSDVLGGYLVATTWTLLAVAGLGSAGSRWPAGSGREAAQRWGAQLAPVAAAGVLACLAVVAVALARPADTVHYAASHTTFVGVAAIVAAACAALTVAISLALRR